MVATDIATNASATKNSRNVRKIWRYCAGAIALAATLSLAGCYGAPLSPRESDALIGGAVGAGGGALVGSAVGSPGTGAVVGGLGGAGLGYIIGNHIQNEYGYGYGYGPYGGWRGGY
jgi:osmotically inducible lipoprotein OsmB